MQRRSGGPFRDLTDTSLLDREYCNATKLDARIELHQRYSTNQYGFYRWVFDHLQASDGAQVLEIGCGSARVWVENSDRIPAGWQLILADRSLGMLHEAQQNLRSCAERWTYLQCDIQQLPLASNTVDLVIANHMLYHVTHRAQAYAEICRILKPGGRLYAATNGRDTMRLYTDLVDRFRPGSGFSQPLPTSSFDLETGGAELEGWFASVELHRYEDALLIPTAQPLAAYAAASSHLEGQQLASFTTHIEALIAADGPLRIEKSVGMFEACSPLTSAAGRADAG